MLYRLFLTYFGKSVLETFHIKCEPCFRQMVGFDMPLYDKSDTALLFLLLVAEDEFAELSASCAANRSETSSASGSYAPCTSPSV